MAHGRALSLALPLAVIAGCAHPQRPPPAPPQRTFEEHMREHPDTFIASRDQLLAVEKQRLEQADLAADIAAIRASVDQHLPAGNYTLRATGATAAILRRQNVDTLAQWLVSTGYRAGDVADPARAAELVQIAARTIVGGGDQKGDSARLAPTVALAELVEVVTEPPRPDGLRFSTIRYRIIEALKNSPPAESMIRVSGGPVHYPDGTMSMSPADVEKTSPGRYVLFLSQRRLSANPGSRVSPDQYASIFGPLRERGASFVPVGDSAHPEMTLDEVRDAIRAQSCSEDHILLAGAVSNAQSC